MDVGVQERAASIADTSIGAFIDALASDAPTPGGGAAAAAVGAVAASLLSMVAALSAGRAKYEAYATTIRRADAVGRRMGAELLRLADVDAEAFSAFMTTWRHSKMLVSEERQTVLAEAGRKSAEAPRQMLGCCVVIADACERLAGRSNPSLASDLVCAIRAAEAAAHCAAENVYVNLANLADPLEVASLRDEATRMVLTTQRHARAARRVVVSGKLRGPEQLGDKSADELGSAPA